MIYVLLIVGLSRGIILSLAYIFYPIYIVFRNYQTIWAKIWLLLQTSNFDKFLKNTWKISSQKKKSMLIS